MNSMNSDLVSNDTLGGPAMFKDDAISPGQGGGTISLFEFLAQNHSLLSLYFAPTDASPPVLLPCLCCGSVTQGVTRRHRFFIFFFIFVMVFFVTLQVELAGHYAGAEWLVIWLLCTCIILPITCRLKTDLPILSERLNQRPLAGPLLVEEALLAVFFLGAVIGGFASGGARLAPSVLTCATDPCALMARMLVAQLLTLVGGGAGVTAGTLYHFTGSYLACIASELASLIWKYFFCRLCCICCLPAGEGDYAGRV